MPRDSAPDVAGYTGAEPYFRSERSAVHGSVPTKHLPLDLVVASVLATGAVVGRVAVHAVAGTAATAIV